MHSEEILIWLGGLFSLLFFLALSLKFLRVPYIISFMLAGLIGKAIFPEKVIDWVALLEHSAIVFLFFFIGLEYSFERLWNMKNVLKPGVVDFMFNFFPIFLVTYAVTKDLFFSTVVSAALYPSSTSIVAKLLSDYKRLVLPEADLLIGILIFEDIVSIVLLSLISGVGKAGEDQAFLILRSLVFLVLLLFVFYLLRDLASKGVSHVDKIAYEPIFPFMIVGLLLLLCGMGEWLGISSAMVAFLLGVIVPEQSLTYKAVEEKLTDLKELALGVFFFSFTYTSNLSVEQSFLLMFFVLVLSIITKAISTYVGAKMYGLSRRVAIRASLSFLPRGEFSLIFASLLPTAQPFVFLVVLLSSILGSISFVYAPKVASFLEKKIS